MLEARFYLPARRLFLLVVYLLHGLVIYVYVWGHLIQLLLDQHLYSLEEYLLQEWVILLHMGVQLLSDALL